MISIRNAAFVMAAVFMTAGVALDASAQSAADPNGEAPIGIEVKSATKGPSVVGVLSVELVNSDGLQADSARAVVRLRRGSSLATFYAGLDEPVYFDTDDEKAQFQADLLAAFRDDVLDSLYDDDCGGAGVGCILVLKQADEFGLTDDGTNQFAVLDVAVALAPAP